MNGGALGSGIVEDPFPNNIIPFSRMDASSLRYQALFIKPTQGGLVNNSIQPAFSNYRHTTIPSFKIDQNLSSKIKISGILFRRRAPIRPMRMDSSEELSPATPQNTRAQTIRANFDDTLTPTLLLHVGVGLLYFNADQYPPSFNAGQILGWGANQQFPANNIMPQVAGLSQLL